VVEAVGRGLRKRDIAHTLSISEKTVKTHVNPIFSKLHIESRFTLALWARGELQPRAQAQQSTFRLPFAQLPGNRYNSQRICGCDGLPPDS